MGVLKMPAESPWEDEAHLNHREREQLVIPIIEKTFF